MRPGCGSTYFWEDYADPDDKRLTDPVQAARATRLRYAGRKRRELNSMFDLVSSVSWSRTGEAGGEDDGLKGRIQSLGRRSRPDLR